MEKLARPEILKIKPYVPGKPVEEVERELGIKDVVKLASNENPLGPSPLAVEALRKSVDQVHFYPDGNCYYLKRALEKHWGHPPEELLVGNGSDELLTLIAQAYLQPGEEIVMGDPSFSEYDFAAKIMGGVVKKVPLKDYTHDLKAMAGEITEKTKMVFVCNPNNPTGTMVTRADVAEFMKNVPGDVLVIFDEAYYEYVDDPAYPDSLQYVREGRNVIVLRTFSKVYGLAGLRIGYAIAPKEIVSTVNRVREPFNVNLLAQRGALAALGDEEFLQKSRAANREGMQMLYRGLEELNLKYVPSQTNFIFIDTGRDCQDVFKKLLQKGVIVRTGDIFGHPTFIRLTVGTLEGNRKFLSCLKEVLEEEA